MVSDLVNMLPSILMPAAAMLVAATAALIGIDQGPEEEPTSPHRGKQ